MTEITPDTPKKRRWVMPLLYVSLFVNLLVAGLVIGAMLSPDGPRRRADDRPARGVIGEPFVRALPAEERRALMKDVLSNGDRIRESRESLRQRFEAFLAALRADPFDNYALNLWAVGDHLRKGAALNAVQIAEAAIDRGML